MSHEPTKAPVRRKTIERRLRALSVSMRRQGHDPGAIASAIASAREQIDDVVRATPDIADHDLFATLDLPEPEAGPVGPRRSARLAAASLVTTLTAIAVSTVGAVSAAHMGLDGGATMLVAAFLIAPTGACLAWPVRERALARVSIGLAALLAGFVTLSVLVAIIEGAR